MAIEPNRVTEVQDGPSPEDLAVVRPPRQRRWWLAGVGLAVGAGLLGVWSLGGREDTSWETELTRAGDLTTTVTAVGAVEPLTTVEVGSDLSGKLSSVRVEQNASVRAGDVLAELDPESFQAQAAQAQASVRSAWATVEKARVTLADAEASRDRTSRLEGQGAAAPTETAAAILAVDRARADLQSAQAGYAQAKAALDRAEQDLRETTILSPIDGVVVQRYVEPGQTVVSAMQATPLFEVASDLHQLTIEAGVDEADVARVSVGQPATFTVSAWPDRTFEATVASVDLAPDPDASVVSYNAELRVDNPDLALLPGMTATAEVQVASLEDVVLVPAAALRFRPRAAEAADGDTVYVVEDEPKAVPVEILGTDGLYTAVEGIAAGAAVIVGGGR